MKPWFKSKTIWFNSGIFFSALAAALIGEAQAGRLPTSVQGLTWLMVAHSALNILLRGVTTQPLSGISDEAGDLE